MIGAGARARALVLAFAFALSACDTELLGPLECESLALTVTGIRDPRSLVDPRARALVEHVTSECLTTPFDREMFRCVERRGRLEPCLRELERRHPERRVEPR